MATELNSTVKHVVSLPFVQAIPAELEGAVTDLESRLGFRLPGLYREFVSQFEFDAFELKGVEFFPNHVQNGGYSIESAVFRDPIMSRVLIDANMFQVGRSDTGSYDPVCFDLSKRKGKDCVLIRLDHEAALQYARISVVEKVSSGFGELVERGS